MRWDLVSGEYPPQRGGVSDYVGQVAHALATAGDETHVWAPPCASVISQDSAVRVHRLPDHFGPRTVALLGGLAGPAHPDRRWVVQYTPQAFGWRAMNVPFCLWLYTRGRAESVWTMFHEVVYPFRRCQPLSHNVMAAVTRGTASLVARASERIFVSIPAWAGLLRRLGAGPRSITWLPVPSNIPARAAPEAIGLVRKRLAPEAGQQVLGHFGTFGEHVRTLLASAIPLLLAADPRRVAVLVGRGGGAFVAGLQRAEPALKGRVYATGGLAPDAVAAHLAACDVLLQPYPDGVSSRRGSVMAGLALGLPIVTTVGPLTEPIWKESGAVVLVPAFSPAAFVGAADTVLTAADEQGRLRRRATELYRERFALERTIKVLREARSSQQRPVYGTGR